MLGGVMGAVPGGDASVTTSGSRKRKWDDGDHRMPYPQATSRKEKTKGCWGWEYTEPDLSHGTKNKTRNQVTSREQCMWRGEGRR